MTPYYDHAGITLWYGDCLDVLPELEAGSFDSVVADPPYGIAYEASQYPGALFAGVMAEDDAEFDPAHLLALGLPMILWGANNYANWLPRGGWLCWDKRCCEAADRVFGSPFELAWISDRAKFKMLRLQHGGAINADGHGIRRVHPTQKPVALMSWCLKLLKSKHVLDPYCGSGTTLVAAKQLGLAGVGIEIEEKYCEAAAKRLEQEVLPLRLAEPPVEPCPLTLF